MQLTLKRCWMVENKPTIGFLFNGTELICAMFELPWKNNQHEISCIPGGEYPCRWDAERGRYWVDNVPERSAIQIHPGNGQNDSKGCLLPGFTINSFQGLTVGLSKIALAALHKAAGDNFTLKIEL